MSEKKSWLDTVSETVDKAAKAANEAWDGTADLRKDAWEKTKTAASSASDAVDQGVEQAKRSFQGKEDPSQEQSAETEEPNGNDPKDHEDSTEPDVT